ncbi:MAG: TlyA family RNA methyltransferase [Bdellovibrionales bacterium]|nr:TlyA family RNA methyltransferase [Bdellovibrionales bacterium]
MKKKERLDLLLVEYGLAESQSRAEAYIRAGEVYVDGVCVDKPGTPVSLEADVSRKGAKPFVSRGGYKLQKALESFGVDPRDKICVDIGSSTGGFTDVLLQSGARKVYAIDNATGELDWKLRSDERVVVLEGTNARHLESLPEPGELIVIDVSLLSLLDLTDTISRIAKKGSQCIALLKPQYEADPEELPKGAVISNERTHRTILLRVLSALQNGGFGVQGLIPSPITGKSGNREFLVWFSADFPCEDISSLIAAID